MIYAVSLKEMCVSEHRKTRSHMCQQPLDVRCTSLDVYQEMSFVLISVVIVLIAGTKISQNYSPMSPRTRTAHVEMK